MKHLSALFARYKILLLAFLKPLGLWGMLGIAFLDSSSIPVPMDLIVATYVWADHGHVVWYVLMAAIGSALGGLVPFMLGRAGGELFLLNHIDRKRFEKMRDRFERQEFFAVLVPSLLPPPTPWKVFVFGAGVFEMKTLRFMAAVFLGRLIRFSILSALVIRYGPEIVSTAGGVIHQHRAAVIVVGCLAAAALLWWTVRKFFGREKAPTPSS